MVLIDIYKHDVLPKDLESIIFYDTYEYSSSQSKSYTWLQYIYI